MHPVSRLILGGALALIGCMVQPFAHAGTDTHATSSEAGAHCWAQAPANLANVCSTYGGTGQYCNKPIEPKNAMCSNQPAGGNVGYQEKGECWAYGGGGCTTYFVITRLETVQTNIHNYTTNDCATKPQHTDWDGNGDGSLVCHEGCSYEDALDPRSPSGVSYDPTGSTCSMSEVSKPVQWTPPPDTDGDGVPDTTDAFPNDPKEQSDTDGDGVGDNNDVAPEDPTNGADGGTGNEGDNTASGGGTCDVPPACYGDGIMCNVLYQGWRARCAAEGANTRLDAIKDAIVDGGGTDPGAPGDDGTHSRLDGIKSTLENIVGKLGEFFGDGTEGNGLGEAPGMPISDLDIGDGPGGDPADDYDSGITSGMSCPTLPTTTISLMGSTADLTFGLDMFCDFAQMIYAVILASASIVSLYIVVGGAR